MYKLICLLNLFTVEQTIYMLDTTTGTSHVAATTTLDELSEKIVDISDVVKVNHIELHGAPSYSAAIADDIYAYAKTRYNNNDLIVEVVQ